MPKPDFITVDPAAGSGNGNINVTAAPNQGESRSGSMSIQGGGLGKTVEITQTAGEFFLVAFTPATLYLPFGPKEQITNLDWDNCHFTGNVRKISMGFNREIVNHEILVDLIGGTTYQGSASSFQLTFGNTPTIGKYVQVQVEFTGGIVLTISVGKGD